MIKINQAFTALLFTLFLSSLNQEVGAYNIKVAQDGTGDVTTVQAAFDRVPNNNNAVFIIFISKGTYKEKLRLVASKTNVHIVGEDITNTILTYDDYASKAGVGGTDNSYSTLIEANNFYAENLTFENTIDARQAAYAIGGQAVALMLRGDKCIIYNCVVRGFQDTFYTKGIGRTYVRCCTIAGTTDFIFGSGIAVFENCHIINRKDSHTTAAANLSIGNKYNYVFLGCKIKGAEGTRAATLGRPWKAYAKVVYLHCELGEHISKIGWSDWSSAKYDTTAYFAEYKSVGAGSSKATRIPWSHQLTKEEASEYTLAKIFGAFAAVPNYSDDWLPELHNKNCSGLIFRSINYRR